ncbi:hypothetical protein QAD02_018113 [Eretmocerus hayati]|uniref:Uncharacterized protein n=1 Tax=Eretmocerus hayati TaxID=131215 RepID=A0ACC2PH17_9HYME|nr:hypothetical protein QAD02_018113 [Eretmocerus hayati]
MVGSLQEGISLWVEGRGMHLFDLEALGDLLYQSAEKVPALVGEDDAGAAEDANEALHESVRYGWAGGVWNVGERALADYDFDSGRDEDRRDRFPHLFSIDVLNRGAPSYAELFDAPVL